MDLLGSCFLDTQDDISVYVYVCVFSFDLFILGVKRKIQSVSYLACVHLYPKMTSPH